MTTKALGAEGFRWFVGVVEDRDDPEKLGRLRVRVHHYHDDKSLIPTEDLPWAFVMLPVISSSLQQVGISPTGIQVGSTVVGFFADGNEGQIPVILGSMPGIPDTGHDVNSLARGTQNLAKSQLGPEPASAYAAKYPFNKTVTTERGHAFEVDDTPGKERIHMYHRTGTYMEIDEKGRRVNKIVADDYEIIAGNQEVFIKGNVNIVVKGNVKMQVDGTFDLNSNKACTITSGELIRLRAPKIFLN